MAFDVGPFEELGVIMKAMLTCAEDALTEPVNLAYVAPGNSVSWDDCCGQLWTRVISIVAAPAMAKQAISQCVQMYQVRVGIGTIRCMNSLDDVGNFPTSEVVSYDAFREYRDMADLRKAMICCIPEIPGVETWRIEQWLPSGPDGGCGGGEWTATFNYNMQCIDCS